MNDKSVKSIYDVAIALIDLYKKVVVLDQPEAIQLTNDLTRAFVRAQRVIKKHKLLEAKAKSAS